MTHKRDKIFRHIINTDTLSNHLIKVHMLISAWSLGPITDLNPVDNAENISYWCMHHSAQHTLLSPSTETSQPDWIKLNCYHHVNRKTKWETDGGCSAVLPWSSLYIREKGTGWSCIHEYSIISKQNMAEIWQYDYSGYHKTLEASICHMTFWSHNPDIGYVLWNICSPVHSPHHTIIVNMANGAL